MVTTARIEQWIKQCDGAMAFSFYAMIYFLPISIALCEIFTSLAFIIWLLKRGAVFYQRLRETTTDGAHCSFCQRIKLFLRSFKPIANPLNIPIALFLLFNFISMLLSQHRMVSIEGFLGKTLQNSFLYFNFIECINSRGRFKIFFRVFFVSIVLISVNGIYQYFVGHEFIHGSSFDGRISSSFRHANDYAAYLVVVSLILLGSVFSLFAFGKKAVSGQEFFVSRRSALFCLSLFVLTSFSLGLTYSRGAWLGFLFAMLYLSWRRRNLTFFNLLIIIVFFGIFYPQLKSYRHVELWGDSWIEVVKTPQQPTTLESALAPTGSSLGPSEGTLSEPSLETESLLPPTQAVIVKEQRRASFFGDIKEIFLLQVSQMNASGRRAYWQEAIHMIRDYPVFGVGINAYSLVAPRYKITWGGYPHNCYLQMLVEIGIVGFLPFLWILFRIFRVGIIHESRVQDPSLVLILVGAMSGFLGFLVHSSVDTNFYSVQLGSLMWLMMGLITVIREVGSRTA